MAKPKVPQKQVPLTAKNNGMTVLQAALINCDSRLIEGGKAILAMRLKGFAKGGGQ
jgi:hypothetical protein